MIVPLLLSILICNSTQWDRKIHILITRLATTNLSTKAKNDINHRLRFFPSINNNQDSDGELSAVVDRFKFLGFNFLKDKHYLNVFELDKKQISHRTPLWNFQRYL